MQLVDLKVGWADRERWAVRDDAVGLCQDWLSGWMAQDVEDACKMALNYTNPGCVIQAGGLIGVWPLVMGRHFETVHVFEPDPFNYPVCALNTADQQNVIVYPTGLGAEIGSGSMTGKGVSSRAARLGEGDIRMITIDSTRLVPSLIYLDIEGGEVPALEGARRTIATHKPVIGLEDNGQGPSGAEWLQREFGYKVVGYPNARDVMLCAY